jgi:hypothetical protein
VKYAIPLFPQSIFVTFSIPFENFQTPQLATFLMVENPEGAAYIGVGFGITYKRILTSCSTKENLLYKVSSSSSPPSGAPVGLIDCQLGSLLGFL